MSVQKDSLQNVLDALLAGSSLRQAAKNAGLTPWQVLRKCEEDAEFAQQYARSISVSVDVQFEDLIESVNEEPVIDNFGKVDSGWVNYKRLQIDTKKWALSKRKPSKYGDKLIVDGDVKITRIVVRDAPADMENREPVPDFGE